MLCIDWFNVAENFMLCPTVVSRYNKSDKDEILVFEEYEKAAVLREIGEHFTRLAEATIEEYVEENTSPLILTIPMQDGTTIDLQTTRD